MRKVVVVLFSILVASIQLSAKPTILIATDNSKPILFFKTLTEALSYRFEAKTINVKSRSKYLRELKKGHQLLILTSSSVADDYLSLDSEQRGNIPLMAVVEGYEEYKIKNLTQRGVVMEAIQIPSNVSKTLSTIYDSDESAIGYLYTEDNFSEMKVEHSFLEQDSIPYLKKFLENSRVVDELFYSISRISGKGVSVFRLPSKGSIIDVLETDSVAASYLEQRATTIISNDPSIDTLFRNSAIVILREDHQFTASSVALLASAMVDNGLPLEVDRYIHINSTIASLSMGEVRNMTLSLSHKHLYDTLAATIQEDTIMWDKVITVMDDFFELPYRAFEKVEVPASVTIVDRIKALLMSKYVMVGGGGFFFMVLLLFIFRKKRKKKKQVQRTVVLYPAVLKDLGLRDTNNNPITCLKYFKNRSCNVATASTIAALNKVVKKKLPDIFIVDWKNNSSAVTYLRSELGSHALSSAKTVIIFNLPANEQTVLTNGFGKATTALFTGIPSTKELIEGLEGKGSSEEKTKDAHLSGIIRSNSLASIVQLLESNQDTGALVIEDTAPLSVIYYKNGRIVYAEDRFGNRGGSAIYNGLNCTSGSFRFLLNRGAPAESLNLGSMEVLLTMATEKDHQARGA